MNPRFKRVGSASQPCWIAGLASLAMLLLPAAGRDIDRLDDFELFARAGGAWEGVGVSFDIAPSGALQPAITFRDTWEANLSKDGRLMVMNGVTRAGGRKIQYVWRFRWHPGKEAVTAEYENSMGEASSLEATVVADGKRLELRTPPSGAGDDGSGMFLDIYLEDEGDLVIEVSIRDPKGERYRSAARYRQTEERGEAGSKGV